MLTWEVRLMRRLMDGVGSYVTEHKSDTRISAEFLAALTANESGGDPHATRFEPGVYQHLKNVADGRATCYGSITKSLLDRQIAHQSSGEHEPGSLHESTSGHESVSEHEPSSKPSDPADRAAQGSAARESASATHENPSPAAKADSYHAEHLTASFSASCATTLSALEDQAVRRLATSWGLTQIMGYHMLGRPEPVEKLCDPAYHYALAARMIEDFAARFHLDPQHDFEALFRCWNTGRPDGKTFDPSYAERGLRRIEICRRLTAAPSPTAAAGVDPSSRPAAATKPAGSHPVAAAGAGVKPPNGNDEATRSR